MRVLSKFCEKRLYFADKNFFRIIDICVILYIEILK